MYTTTITNHQRTTPPASPKKKPGNRRGRTTSPPPPPPEKNLNHHLLLETLVQLPLLSASTIVETTEKFGERWQEVLLGEPGAGESDEGEGNEAQLEGHRYESQLHEPLHPRRRIEKHVYRHEQGDDDGHDEGHCLGASCLVLLWIPRGQREMGGWGVVKRSMKDMCS